MNSAAANYRSASAVKRLKYRVFQYLPGPRGLYYRRKLIEANAPKTLAAFEAAKQASRGKIAIDLGANRGLFARELAQSAAHVHAFEPDPWTAAILKEELKDLDNVTVHEAAAGVAAGTLPIFRHRDYEDNPLGLSQSTTLRSDVRDVDGAHPVAEVEVIDFLAFLKTLEGQVGILKIDIEGGELELMPALMQSSELQKIDYIFCETHEGILPEARDQFATIRAQARQSQHPIINMDWL